MIGRDITPRKSLQPGLRRAEEHDPLTDVFNRRRFEQEMLQVLADAGSSPTCSAVLFLDLDDFQSVNDSLGHPAGDDVLRHLARALQRLVRPGDFLARLGGDEFAILLRNADRRKALNAAGQLLAQLRQEGAIVGGQTIRLTASIGVAMIPEHGLTVTELMANAELALYEAKKGGGNTACIFNPRAEGRALSQMRLNWRNHVVKALEESRFHFLCQPIRSLRTNETTKFELLLRSHDDEGEVVLPAQLIGVAERHGLIPDIDRWVIRRAIALIAALKRQGRPLQIAINVSAVSISSVDMHKVVKSELAAWGADPAQLILEITETAAVQDRPAARRFVRRVKALGCRVALDDFGSGHSSLMDARDLPVDYLKIDGGFVSKLTANPTNELIVKAIAALATALGRETIAEFVDSRKTADRLAQIGVHYAQGFYIGQPQPLEEALQLPEDALRLVA